MMIVQDYSEAEEEVGFETPEKMASGKPLPPTCTPDPTCATAKGGFGKDPEHEDPTKNAVGPFRTCYYMFQLCVVFH